VPLHGLSQHLGGGAGGGGGHAPDPMSPEPAAKPGAGAPVGLGRLLKLRRLERGMSLRKLAGVAGCSASFLSMIEQERISPSLRSLGRICAGLDTSVSDLLRPAEADAEPVVVRRAETRGNVVMRWDRAVARMLLPPEINCQFTLMVTVIKPGGETSLRISPHPLPEVHLVLRGNPTFLVDETRIDLHAGDCVYLDLTRPHKVVNPTRSTVKILAINPSQFHLINDLEGNRFPSKPAGVSRARRRGAGAA
jgi:transcriptional regulator with XRE-family HTH domain